VGGRLFLSSLPRKTGTGQEPNSSFQHLGEGSCISPAALAQQLSTAAHRSLLLGGRELTEMD